MKLIPFIVLILTLLFVATLVFTCDPEPATTRAMQGR